MPWIKNPFYESLSLNAPTYGQTSLGTSLTGNCEAIVVQIKRRLVTLV